VKVESNVADEYFIVSLTWKDPNTIGHRFCSRECADIYFNKQSNELLAQRERNERYCKEHVVSKIGCCVFF